MDLTSSAIFLAKNSALLSLAFRLNLIMLVQQKQQISSKLDSKIFLFTYLFILQNLLNFYKISLHIQLIFSSSKALLRILLSIVLKVFTNRFFTRRISVLVIQLSISLMYLLWMKLNIDLQSSVSFDSIYSNRLFLINSISLQVPNIRFVFFHLSMNLNVCSAMCLKTFLKRVKYYCKICSFTGISGNQKRTSLTSI